MRADQHDDATTASGAARRGEPSRQVTRRLDGADGTRAWAAELAGLLAPGDLLILTGELGAGKTTFTQGLGEGLGVRAGITSPTFVLSRIHPSLIEGPDLVHVDAYRLRSSGELDGLDLDATAAGAVTVVEWGRGLAESLVGWPQDESASWLDVEILRPTGAQAVADHDDASAAGPTAPGDTPGFVTDFSDEEGTLQEEVRTAVLTLNGPRWDGVQVPGRSPEQAR